MVRFLLIIVIQFSYVREAFAIDNFYGFQSDVASSEMKMAPQVKLDLSLVVRAEEIRLQSSRVFLGDIFGCVAPGSICQELQAIDLGESADPGGVKITSLEALSLIIEEDIGNRFDIQIEGPSIIRLLSDSMEIQRREVEEELMHVLERGLDHNQKVVIKSLFIRPGIKVFPGELSWRFEDIEPILVDLNQLSWQQNQAVREVNVSLESRNHGVSSEVRFKIRFRLSALLKVPVARTTIPQGDILRSEKFTYEWLELKSEPILDLDSVSGKRLVRRLPRGQYLKKSDVHEPFLVERGQMVDVILMTGSLQLRGQARALASGRLGQSVPVQLTTNRKRMSGQVVSASTVKVME